MSARLAPVSERAVRISVAETFALLPGHGEEDTTVSDNRPAPLPLKPVSSAMSPRRTSLPCTTADGQIRTSPADANGAGDKTNTAAANTASNLIVKHPCFITDVSAVFLPV